MRREEADGNTVVSQPRCEIEKTFLGGECHNEGEVRYGGTLLCAPHATLLGLEDRAEALLSSVFRMDEWLEENGDAAADDEFVGAYDTNERRPWERCGSPAPSLEVPAKRSQ